MRIFSAVIITMTLVGCGDQYRYPCQDPANWNRDICQKPLCDINRTCPEHIFRGSDITKMFAPGAEIPNSMKNPPGGAATAPAAPAAPRPGPRPPVTGVCK